MKSFREFITELSNFAYDKYRNDAHRLGDRLWHRHFAAGDSGSKAKIEKKVSKLDKGIESATVLAMKKKAQAKDK